MKLTINNKERELKFNMGFARRIDEAYTYDLKSEGLSMGMGLEMGYPLLLSRKLTALTEFCKAAIGGDVTYLQVEKAIDDYAEKHGELETLFEYVIGELGKSPVTKATVTKLKEETAKVEMKLKAK